SDAFGTHNDQLTSHLAYGGRCGWIEFEIEPRREANRPQQPKFVLLHPGVGIADRANPAFVQIVKTADIVENAIINRIEKHPIDREIAALGILLGRREFNTTGMTTIPVISLGTESGDLHRGNAAFSIDFPGDDHDHSKALSD